MLFNKNNQGIQEVKRLLGFVYANLNFKDLVPSLLLAEAAVIRFTGKEIFAAAEARYSTGEYSTELTSTNKLDQLVHKFQLAILLTGYREFARNNDLQHSEAGHTITVTDESKPAFEWMIERDDRALVQKSFKALDLLLDFLETEADTEGFSAWKNSNARKNLRGQLLYSAGQFDEVYRIDQSLRFFILVMPLMRTVERRKILPVIGEARYNSLLTKIKNAENITEAEATLLKAIAEPLCFYTVKEALLFHSDDEMPESLLQSYLPDKANRKNSGDSKLELAKRIKEEADERLMELQQFIRKLEQTGEYVAPPTLPENSDNNLFFLT